VARARAAHAAGGYNDALSALMQALLLAPQDAALLVTLATLLHELGRDVEAQPAAERALALAPADPNAVLVAASVANARGEGARAEALLRALIARSPHLATARARLASLLERASRFEEAEREARAGLKTATHEPLLNLVVAQCALHRGDLDSCELHLGRIRAASGTIPQHAAYLAAQLLAAREMHAEAFAAFATANRLAAAHAARVAPPTDLAEVVAERGVFSDAWVAGWAPLAPPAALPFQPAFLVGFPRSGTTLLEQILDAHPGVSAIEEQPFLDDRIKEPACDHPQGLATLDHAAREGLRARYAAAVLAHRPEAAGRVLVDKLPLNLARAGAIQRLFPEARFLFALRHPYDVVLSCFMQEFAPNPAMVNFHSLEGAARYYDAVMALWAQHRAQQALAVVTVRYEALVDDLEAEVRPALAHLGLDWDPRVAAYAEHARSRGRIRTPSYAQVRQGLYTSARARFVKYLPLFSVEVRALLDPWVERWGYAPVNPGE
jgi:tetratricopeptide (TPR) repeat protein